MAVAFFVGYIGAICFSMWYLTACLVAIYAERRFSWMHKNRQLCMQTIYFPMQMAIGLELFQKYGLALQLSSNLQHEQ